MILSENIKVIEHFDAYLIVCPFEITPQNIILSPGPLILKSIGMLDFHKKLFHFLLELPEGGSTVYDILALEIEVHMETAEGVKCGMIATKIGRVLLIALALVDVVVGIEVMGDELLEGLRPMTDGLHG